MRQLRSVPDLLPIILGCGKIGYQVSMTKSAKHALPGIRIND